LETDIGKKCRTINQVAKQMVTRDIKIARRTWTVPQAFHYCERLTYDHYENFPVASLFLPKDKRRHICAIYSFARIADDYADEPGLTAAERIESLNDWEEQLFDCYRGEAHHPVFVALRETVERFQIPHELFRDLLLAFRSDVTTHRYETFDDVLGYCENSANPIGRLILLLFNYRSESMLLQSDFICTGLQLANFWQDVSVDLQKDRVYIPTDDIREFGYSEEELFQHRVTQGFKDMMWFELDRTARILREGKPLLLEVGTDVALELRLTWNGGMKILKKIERAGFDVLNHHPRLTLVDKASLLLSSLLK
jgi:squalene synthase HpnC